MSLKTIDSGVFLTVARRVRYYKFFKNRMEPTRDERQVDNITD